MVNRIQPDPLQYKATTPTPGRIPEKPLRRPTPFTTAFSPGINNLISKHLTPACHTKDGSGNICRIQPEPGPIEKTRRKVPARAPRPARLGSPSTRASTD